MEKLIRFGVSIDSALLKEFDALINEQNYTNRSQAIADLMRQKIVERDWSQSRKNVAGIVSLVYDHHKRDMVTRVMDIQHDFQKLIISTQHIHLDHDNCLEIIACRGMSKDIVDLVRKLRGVNGIKHVSLSTGTGSEKV